MIIDIASLLAIFLEHDNLPFKIELPDIEKKKKKSHEIFIFLLKMQPNSYI